MLSVAPSSAACNPQAANHTCDIFVDAVVCLLWAGCLVADVGITPGDDVMSYMMMFGMSAVPSASSRVVQQHAGRTATQHR
jgi:hypothetical protein